MLTIRFNRTGRKNRPNFRVVLQEHTVAPCGRHVEVLGSYDPYSKKAVLRSDRVRYWITQGVQISDTARNLLVREGVVEARRKAISESRTKISNEKKSVPTAEPVVATTSPEKKRVSKEKKK